MGEALTVSDFSITFGGKRCPSSFSPYFNILGEREREAGALLGLASLPLE